MSSTNMLFQKKQKWSAESFCTNWYSHFSLIDTRINKPCWESGEIIILWSCWSSYLRGIGSRLKVFQLFFLVILLEHRSPLATIFISFFPNPLPSPFCKWSAWWMTPLLISISAKNLLGDIQRLLSNLIVFYSLFKAFFSVYAAIKLSNLLHTLCAANTNLNKWQKQKFSEASYFWRFY